MSEALGIFWMSSIMEEMTQIISGTISVEKVHCICFLPGAFYIKKNLTVSRVGSGPGGPGFYSCKLHVRNLPFRAGT